MKSYILTFFLSLILGSTLAHGAVIMVSPGQSVQAAINSASTGDEIVLQVGSYNEDLNVTGKGLTFRAFNLPWIVKSISVFNSSTPCKFENFQLLKDLNSTGTDLEVRNANIGGSITVNQAGLKLTKSTIDNQVIVNLQLMLSDRIRKLSLPNQQLPRGWSVKPRNPGFATIPSDTGFFKVPLI